ncbi:sulfatase-like hydrolase/transferase [Paenibacillus doosanensis]|uniref:sulfatase-like hydrolase/transferase n=1 Tax=Paenibacillus doosanensis TaxID=1229154 RepID=UPI002180324F|nr:sulfatase-like hydrolase/transferase [Paenibacillus doosanensis]MCS7464062.1 sulfatase-like hydrolase/transferase [Paenibacillus doosanensis]
MNKFIVFLTSIVLIVYFNVVPTIAAITPQSSSQAIYGSEITGGKSWVSFKDNNKEVKIHLKNTGNITWTGENHVYLAYHWLDFDGNVIIYDGIRTSLPKDLAPGESVTLLAKVQTPEKAGFYQLQWDMVQENVTWFSGKDPNNVLTTKQVVFNMYYFVYSILILLAIIVVTLNALANKNKVIIPNYIHRFNKWVWSKLDLMWFVIASFLKIYYFSDLTHIVLTPDAKKVSFLFALLIGLLFNLMKHRKRRVAIVTVINLIISLTILGDLVYLEYFDNVLSIPVLLYMGQAASVKGSIMQLLHYNQLYVLADLIIGVVLLLLPQKMYFPELRMAGKSINKKALTGALFVACTALLFLNIKTISKENPGIFVQRFSNSKIVESVGVMNYHLFDAYKFVSASFNKPKVTTDQLAAMSEWFKGHYTNDKNADYGVAKGKNVIVMQVEALQQFVIGLKVNGQEVTPNLNKLIKDSMYYENYFDQTNQGRTSDGEFTSLTSLYPLNEGSVYFSYPQQNYDSLPYALKDNGYTTFSAHAYDGQFWNRKTMHQHLGIDTSMFGSDFAPGENIGWGLSDKDFLSQSVQKIATLQQPFFSFLITLSNHHPYDALPAQYKVFDEKEGSMLDRYLNTAHYTDMAIGAFIDELKSKGLYDNTVLAIYGDHDSAIDIKDISTVVQTGTEPIDASKLDKVPLIIHIPGYTKNATSSTVAGHLDLTPSILHLLGISEENHLFMGNDLFENDPSRLVVFRNGSYADQSHYFLTLSGSIQDGQCYDLSTDQLQPISACSANAEEARKRLDMSDLMIQANLMPRLKSEETAIK